MRKYSDKILLTFNEIIEFVKNNGELSEKVLAVEYNGTMLIVNEKCDFVPEKGKLYLIFLPKDYTEILRRVGVHTKKWRKYPVFAVNIMPVEVISGTEGHEKIVIIKNIYISEEPLEEVNNGYIAKILIREPNEENPNTYLILIRIRDNDWVDIFKTFYEKKNELGVKQKEGVIEILIKREVEGFLDIKKSILEPFHRCFYLESNESEA